MTLQLPDGMLDSRSGMSAVALNDLAQQLRSHSAEDKRRGTEATARHSEKSSHHAALASSQVLDALLEALADKTLDPQVCITEHLSWPSPIWQCMHGRTYVREH